MGRPVELPDSDESGSAQLVTVIADVCVIVRQSVTVQVVVCQVVSVVVAAAEGAGQDTDDDTGGGLGAPHALAASPMGKHLACPKFGFT